MSNTVTTLFPDEPRPQAQNCTVDISGGPWWNHWRPYNPQIVWIGGMPAPTPTTDEPCDDEDNDEPEPADKDEEEECLTLTIGDVEAMLRRVVKEELGTLRIVQGKQ